MSESTKYDVLVVGGGMVGLTTAFALCKAGLEVVLCAPKQDHADPRTTALLDGSVKFLDELGLWQEACKQAHPLKTMRLVDGTRRLFRFQQTDFRSSEIGLDAFGYNIRNAELMTLIENELDSVSSFDRITGSVKSIDVEASGGLRVELKSDAEKLENLCVGFVVGADGRKSFVREQFGHGAREWSYPQSALVVDFEHEFDSGFASTEFHTETGPFTIVPHSSKRAGLVFLETPEKVTELVAMPENDLNLVLEEKMQSFLGKVRLVSKPQAFPMSGLTANCLGDAHHALVGEAAHVFPPIGAQGFNLGIRDIQELVQSMKQFTSTENPGHQYHRARSVDVYARTAAVDLLNRSLLSEFLPVQAAKAAGMFALGNIPPLRRQAMKLGISPLRQ